MDEFAQAINEAIIKVATNLYESELRKNLKIKMDNSNSPLAVDMVSVEETPTLFDVVDESDAKVSAIRLTDVEIKILTAWYFSTDEDWPYRKKPIQKEMATLLNRNSRTIRHLIDRLKKMPAETKDAVLGKTAPMIGSTSRRWREEEDKDLLDFYAIPDAERPRVEVLAKRINRSARAIYMRKYTLTHSMKGEDNAD